MKIRDKTKEAKGDEQSVKRCNLQVFQVLQREIDYSITVRLLWRGVTESTPGFKAGAKVSEIDQVITCGNAGEQRNHYEQNGYQSLRFRVIRRASRAI
jgi:hypothetical protein